MTLGTYLVSVVLLTLVVAMAMIPPSVITEPLALINIIGYALIAAGVVFLYFAWRNRKESRDADPI